MFPAADRMRNKEDPMKQSNHSIFVIGHRNPDTDSICSAIAYAALKNKTDHSSTYEPRRAGEINRETEFVLNYFGTEAPRLCIDVSPQIRDADYRDQMGISKDTSLRQAWTIMRNKEIDTLPVVDADGSLLGLVAVKDITIANMDVLDTEVLAKSRTPYRNILETLDGKMVTGDPDECVTTGRIFIGAARPESMEETVKSGDILILSNRYESQLCAIEIGVSLLIVCQGAAVSRTIRLLAEEKKVAIMSVPYDTYAAAKLICQSAPVSHIMTTQNILQFNRYTLIDEALKVMAKYRHRYFPVLDESGKYSGMISRRNIITMPRRQLILVDHNEATQTVEGAGKAEILEIIDHHRIGRPETSNPIYFRNQPVGCTATIVAQMYSESGVDIPRQIAGLLLGAILSDTLAFRSPTCTPIDERTAKMLAGIAQVDINQFANDMFEAGEQLSGKTPEEVLLQDFKVFLCGDIRFGVAQVNFMTGSNIQAAQQLIRPYMTEALGKQKIEDLYVMFTNVPQGESTLLCAGYNAERILADAFRETAVENSAIVLPGVISRKKQVVPALMAAYQQL